MLSGSLRKRAYFYLLMITLLAGILGWGITARLLERSSQQLLVEQQQRVLQRADRLLNNELLQLATQAERLAMIERAARQPLLQDASKIRFALWRDSAGHPQFGFLREGERVRAMRAQDWPWLLSFSASSRLLSGPHIIWQDALPMLTRQIPLQSVTGNDGWLLVGQPLDATARTTLEHSVGAALRFSPTRPAAQPSRRLLPSASGAPLFVSTEPDPLLQQWLTERNRTLLLAIPLLAALLCAAIALLIELLILRRLTQLSRLTISPSEGSAPLPRWPVRGSDEFDTLALSLNDMADQLRHSQHRLFDEVRRDGLTRLGNRKLLIELLDRHIPALQETPQLTLALLLVDLDEFKVVNDSLGHERGDRVLALVAERLMNLARGSDSLFRLGGDEFAILCLLPRQSQGAERLAERVLQDLDNHPLLLENTAVQLSASIGVAYYQPALSSSELLRNADLAMYEAKRLGRRHYRIYSDAMHHSVSERLHAEQALRQALHEQQLEIWFQPILDTRDGNVVMVEALVRWPRGQGYVPPSDFIALAEETGLIIPMGIWIARQALRALPALREHWPELNLNINLSVLQLMQSDLVPRLCALVDECAVPHSAVHFELTESLFAEQNEFLVNQLRQLSDAGFKVHLDDFGTGYSSLERLLTLPVDTLKLDRSFTQTLERGDERLVKAVLLISQEMDMQVIAEGVETEKEMQRLQALGCHLMQGYLFAKPMPLPEIREWLTRHGAPRSPPPMVRIPQRPDPALNPPSH